MIYLLYLYIFLCLCPFISTETLLSWYPFFWFQCYLGIPNPPKVDSQSIILFYKADVLNIQLSDQKVQILVNTYIGGCFSNLLLCQNQLSFKNTEYISWFTNTWNNRIKSSSVSTANSASTNTEKHLLIHKYILQDDVSQISFCVNGHLGFPQIRH